MRKSVFATAFWAIAANAEAQTTVKSTFAADPRDSLHKYSNAANWSPAEVPDNSSSKIYDVTVPFSYVNLDMDATVESLTLTGQRFSQSVYAYTVIGTTTVGDSILDVSGPFSIKGSLSNFDPISKTLCGGRYYVWSVDGYGAANLSFPGADIVNNGALISLLRPTSIITDAAGRDALRNFARNLAGASFAVAARDYTVDNVFTNDGLLTVGVRAESLSPSVGASLRIGSLTNYDRQSNRLAGGSYDIIASAGSASGVPAAAPAQLIVTGADIVRNAASITLGVTGFGELVYDPSFTDENGKNALRNFAENEPAGVFQLKYLTHTFQTNSDFTNAGSVLVEMSSLGVPPAHVYRQTSGGTTLTGGTISGDVEILGGGFFAVEDLNRENTAIQTPAINGNLTVGDALFDPVALKVSGSVVFSDKSRFFLVLESNFKGLTTPSTLALAGTLEIRSGAPSTIAHAASISGLFQNAPNGSRVFTIDGHGSYVVTYTDTDVKLSDFQPAAQSVGLLNISTRAQVLTGDDVAIGGFIVSGSEAKNVVIRAIGPSLAQAGVTGSLQDPVMELYDAKGVVVATNDNWRDTQGPEISVSGVPPRDPRESGIFASLPAGAYTAVVRGKNGASGVALLEIYDLSSGSPTKLANISTRGFVDADHFLIGGLIAGGSASDNVQVVLRAIGQGLESSGVGDFLPDPALELRDRNGALVAGNDDFATPKQNEATVPAALRPSSATDAAIAVAIGPGSYTVIVHGKDGASGTALVEIYRLDQ